MHARSSKIWPDLVDSDDSDVENEIDVDKLPPLEVGPGENRLQHTYCLWFSRKGTQRAAADYSKSLHVVGRCASVQQWWSLYSHLIRPTALKPYRELSLFKQGIKPMWEDPANSKGGQWVIRLRKNKIERAWENVCMAMLGEQFLVGDEICGIVLQTKFPVSSLFLTFYQLLNLWKPCRDDRDPTNILHPVTSTLQVSLSMSDRMIILIIERIILNDIFSDIYIGYNSFGFIYKIIHNIVT